MAMGHSTLSVIKHVPNLNVNHKSPSQNSWKGSRRFVSIINHHCHPRLQKAGVVALHAILVKKRISLTSLPHSITKRLLQIREIDFCLKALFGIMVTLAPIYCTFCFWLRHEFNYLMLTSL